MFDSFYNNLHSLNNYIDYVPSEIAGRFYGLKEFKYLCCQKQSVMNTATPSHRTTAENTSFQGRILYFVYYFMRINAIEPYLTLL